MAAEKAGFKVTESFVDNDPVTLYDMPVIFISDEGSQLSEEWLALSGKNYLGINKMLKATALAASPLGTEDLLDMAEKMQLYFTADETLYDIHFEVTAPKRNELHKRVQCEIKVTATYTAAEEE